MNTDSGAFGQNFYMMPAGPLMIEHRLIERMVDLLKNQKEKIEKEHKADVIFLYNAIDFFRTYADRCHHGKEEDILFKALAQKGISDDHAKILGELLNEHTVARKVISRLSGAVNNYREGQPVMALEDINGCLGELIQLYPAHIEKEDKHFFLPCMDYFSKQERDAMLEKFWKFDRELIHEKYKGIVEEFE
ncbi:MAG: hemerythrin domain-containing protein [Candidatus Omnitrophota bacterium]